MAVVMVVCVSPLTVSSGLNTSLAATSQDLFEERARACLPDRWTDTQTDGFVFLYIEMSSHMSCHEMVSDLFLFVFVIRSNSGAVGG